MRRRAGSAYDPDITDRVVRAGAALFGGLDSESVWEDVLAAEPHPIRSVDPADLDVTLGAFAFFADLKSPYLATHSTGVAQLAGAAAERAGLPGSDVADIRRAGLVHDLGRAGVPNSVWDRPGPLSAAEWERVRLHAYYTERVLARSPGLARLVPLAGLHHERLDGSGYHRGAPSGWIATGARILAAADVYHALTEPRPHRPAREAGATIRELRAEVRAGRLDGEAADAVIGAAGYRVRRRRAWPAGLSPREVEVLRLVARGLSNRRIARALIISEPTAAHHVRHIYAKIGVSTRAAATLFAMRYVLLVPSEAAET